MSTVMEGMAFGTGSAIAHRAVGAVFGSMGGGAPAAPAESAAQAATAPVSAKTIADKCAPYQQEVRRCHLSDVEKRLRHFFTAHPPPPPSPMQFVACISSNKTDLSACQMYSDQLVSCQERMA